MTIDDAVEECRERITPAYYGLTIPEELIARLIAEAPNMYGLLCVLLRNDMLEDTHTCRALSRARSIIERVTGEKRIWPDEAGEGTP